MELETFLKRTKIIAEIEGKKREIRMSLKEFIEYIEALKHLGVKVEITIIPNYFDPIEVKLAETLEKWLKIKCNY